MSNIFDSLPAGMSEDEIMHEYPSMVRDDIKAALAYGAFLAQQHVLPLPGTNE